MTKHTESLRQAKCAAQSALEVLEVEARTIRAQLTAAERRARAARKTFEAARLAYLEAAEREVST